MRSPKAVEDFVEKVEIAIRFDVAGEGGVAGGRGGVRESEEKKCKGKRKWEVTRTEIRLVRRNLT